MKLNAIILIVLMTVLTVLIILPVKSDAESVYLPGRIVGVNDYGPVCSCPETIPVSCACLWNQPPWPW